MSDNPKLRKNGGPGTGACGDTTMTTRYKDN